MVEGGVGFTPAGQVAMRNESGTIVEDRNRHSHRLGEVILNGDPELDDHERTEAEGIGQRNASAEKKPVAGVERCAAIVLADVVGIRGEIGNARGVAIGVVQVVIAKQLNFRADADVLLTMSWFWRNCDFGNDIDRHCPVTRAVREEGSRQSARWR